MSIESMWDGCIQDKSSDVQFIKLVDPIHETCLNLLFINQIDAVLEFNSLTHSDCKDRLSMKNC